MGSLRLAAYGAGLRRLCCRWIQAAPGERGRSRCNARGCRRGVRLRSAMGWHDGRNRAAGYGARQGPDRRPLWAHFLLAVSGRKVVGLNGVALASETNMNLITGICVEPAHQGLGLGTALLGRALAWLRDQGLGRATVTTDVDAVAVHVYDRFGATQTRDVTYPGEL